MNLPPPDLISGLHPCKPLDDWWASEIERINKAIPDESERQKFWAKINSARESEYIKQRFLHDTTI